MDVRYEMDSLTKESIRYRIEYQEPQEVGFTSYGHHTHRPLTENEQVSSKRHNDQSPENNGINTKSVIRSYVQRVPERTTQMISQDPHTRSAVISNINMNMNDSQ